MTLWGRVPTTRHVLPTEALCGGRGLKRSVFWWEVSYDEILPQPVSGRLVEVTGEQRESLHRSKHVVHTLRTFKAELFTSGCRGVGILWKVNTPVSKAVFPMQSSGLTRVNKCLKETELLCLRYISAFQTVNTSHPWPHHINVHLEEEVSSNDWSPKVIYNLQSPL